ncbi:hypothetical protein ACXYRP_03320 [Mycoplasma sp. 5912]
MKRTFKTILASSVLSTSLIALSCSSNKVSINYDDENIDYRLRFAELLDLYQTQTNIKRNPYDFFMLKWESGENNGGYGVETLLKNNFTIFTSSNQVRNDYLSRFSLDFYKKIYNMFLRLNEKERDFNINNYWKINPNNMTQEQINKYNEQKFEEQYLYNQKIDEFFKTKNLVLSTSWHARYRIDYSQIDYLIYNPRSNPDEISFIKVHTGQLQPARYYQPASGGASFMDSAVINKNIKINPIVNDHLTKQEVIDLFEFLEKKYEVK